MSGVRVLRVRRGGSRATRTLGSTDVGQKYVARVDSHRARRTFPSERSPCNFRFESQLVQPRRAPSMSASGEAGIAGGARERTCPTVPPESRPRPPCEQPE